jgi:hypothetical protein
MVLVRVVARGKENDIGLQLALEADHLFQDLLAVTGKVPNGVVEQDKVFRRQLERLHGITSLLSESAGRQFWRQRPVT